MRGTCATSSCRQMRLIRNFTSSCFPRYTIYSSRGEHWGDWSGSQSHIQRALPALQRTASTVQLRNDKIDFPSVIDGKLLPPQFSLPNASAASLLPPPIFISPILYRPSMVIVMSSYGFSFLYHQPRMICHKNRTTTAVNFLMIPHNYLFLTLTSLSVCLYHSSCFLSSMLCCCCCRHIDNKERHSLGKELAQKPIDRPRHPPIRNQIPLQCLNNE